MIAVTEDREMAPTAEPIDRELLDAQSTPHLPELGRVGPLLHQQQVHRARQP